MSLPFTTGGGVLIYSQIIKHKDDASVKESESAIHHWLEKHFASSKHLLQLIEYIYIIIK
jgi:hypothetical protein